MPHPSIRQTWAFIGIASLGIAMITVGLTDWLGLDPCHLCIFQRLLLMLIACLALTAAIFAGFGRFAMTLGTLATLSALFGSGIAGYQSWLQQLPPGSVSCSSSDPGLIERLVEWLGEQAPSLFLATGFCEETAIVVLGLSLADWALICFAAIAGISAWSLWRAWLKRGA